MKNAISFVRNNVIRNLSLALMLTLFAAAPAMAGDKIKEGTAEIKYVGTLNGNTIFQINIENTEAEEFSITLKDEYGNILFFDNSKSKTYTKKVQFEGVQIDDLKLNMTIRSKKGSQTQAFRISKTTRTVEEIAIVNL